MISSNVPDSVRARVRESAGDRCGYCLSPQRLVMGKLEIEHIIPRVLGGSDEEANLWLSCGLCNRYKGSQTQGIDPANTSTVELFNPRMQVWTDHFRWSTDGSHIVGLTGVGHGRGVKA
ncbi:MAG TPA: HNH endonuclease [Blastocatellia bacterium]|nr:HNH endonuclease [Blastocatellia bacterium]